MARIKRMVADKITFLQSFRSGFFRSIRAIRVQLLLVLLTVIAGHSQAPPIERGVSQALAQWRAVNYSNVSYKLNLTLEKMSPVLKGTIEIHVTQAAYACAEPNCPPLAIVLDWRKLPGHEKDSTIANLVVNGTRAIPIHEGIERLAQPEFDEPNDHLVITGGVKMGENVIKLDFTSPILTSGSAITRYIDKEDGSEYIYSLFVPSDASTAFPVFDQPDLKARFSLSLTAPKGWNPLSNTDYFAMTRKGCPEVSSADCQFTYEFGETLPMSTYVFSFGAGPFKVFGYQRFTDFFETQHSGVNSKSVFIRRGNLAENASIYVRASQAAKFQPHAAEVFRLTREGIKYLETYFDYKFPWPKYDIVLIPEFPFGGMEHAGATFLRESSVIFPSEPTKGDQISRANVIFHETAHQWFGDLVTMRWFDDLWLKEGFAEFMAYKTLEKVMPDANAWKVFYERNKQAAYATDSTRGTTPIYQPISNLSAAKSAYGNIVYRKAPSFLRQAEFYLGEDKFQTAVRAFLKKHEYANAGWEDLVGEFEKASGKPLRDWGESWVKNRGVSIFRPLPFGASIGDPPNTRHYRVLQRNPLGDRLGNAQRTKAIRLRGDNTIAEVDFEHPGSIVGAYILSDADDQFVFANYGDYGYGIFLLDDKSRDYVLKHIGEEKDPFLRSMMWGALWDSVREAELDPREYVELVIKQLPTEPDETTVASLVGRVSTALNYYASVPPPIGGGLTKPSAKVSTNSSKAKLQPPAIAGGTDLRARFEAVLLDRMQHAETPGQRIVFFRAFVGNASTEKSKVVLKDMLRQAGVGTSRENHPVGETPSPLLRKEGSQSGQPSLTLRTKDKFDIVTRLMILQDPDGPKLLADLEKTETSDDAKRYAYAAHAAWPTAENRAKYWNDFVNNKEMSESWIESAMGPFNSIRYSELSQPYLARALAELPNHKRTRKIFFVNGWLSAFIGGQRDSKALDIVNKFLSDNPNLDNDLRLKILENVDVVERAVKIRQKFAH